MNDIWKNLASRLSEAEDLPRRPDYSTLPKTTDVIDEEKSVRWNREEVERRRKEWIVKRNTLLRKRNNAVGVVQNDIILQIQKELEEETGVKDLPLEQFAVSGIKPMNAVTLVDSMRFTQPLKTTKTFSPLY